jgi:hypothetical protein
MTYPSSGFQNQWGFYAPATTYAYAPAGTPPATGTLSPPQSPSGSVTNESANWNFVNDETSTQEFLSDVLSVENAQQGTAAISNVASISSSFGGISASNIQVFKWQ